MKIDIAGTSINMGVIEGNTDLFIRGMGKVLDACLNGDKQKYGFMLLVTEFGKDPGVGHYISNCKREDMIKALREKADVLEKGLDIISNENDSKN